MTPTVRVRVLAHMKDMKRKGKKIDASAQWQNDYGPSGQLPEMMSLSRPEQTAGRRLLES